MRAKRTLSLIAAPVAIAALAVGATLGTGTERTAPPRTGFIQGTVTSGDDRPEAGVWVIAETGDLPTPAYRKIVVTNDRGRFVLPELPEADYQVWVRGYGLNDSDKVPVTVEQTGPRRPIALEAEVAGTPQERAAHYPANYWLSLFKPPADTESLPGGRNQHAWMSDFKLGCQLCHQMGSASARGMRGDRARLDAGLLKAGNMNGAANGLGRDAVLDALADWGGRIAAGQVPEAPPRPSGVERNMVITQWQWGLDPALYTYAHDEVATDKRNPMLYPDGKIWGVDLGNDRLLSVDPVTHEADEKTVPTLDGFSTPWNFATLGQPAAGGMTEHLGAYQNPANPHNPMMDDTGKVWMTTAVRPDNPPPAFCTTPPGPNAEHRAPPTRSNVGHRQLGYYDTNSDEFALIHTCFGTHHLQFDEEGVLWLSGDSQVFGWFDPSKFDPDRPRETESDAQGWSQIVVDSDGDGTKDTPSNGFNYGIIPNPVDDTVWTGRPGNPGNIVRYDPGSDMFEVYRPPAPGHGPRGVDVDTKGIIWTGLGGSGHLAKFDRSKCRQTWGTGDQCPEGWTLYRSPGPQIDTGPGAANVTNADFHYYIWVDQFNTLGMGKDTVILNGTGSDSLLAFNQRTEKFTVIRVPYPKNLFTRGLDGRIDDPGAGWKGRGLWFDNGSDPVLHSEVQRSYVGHVQLRPNPLAR
jgi:streptogramin lyase